MSVRILILLASIALLVAILIAKRLRPDMIESLGSGKAGTSSSAIGTWAAIGMALGAGIGAGIDEVGVGVAVGTCIGAAVGSAINKRTRARS